MSLQVPLGPFFRRWGCLEAAGAPDPGPCQRGRCAKNDVGLDTWGGGCIFLVSGTPKWKFPLDKGSVAGARDSLDKARYEARKVLAFLRR